MSHAVGQLIKNGKVVGYFEYNGTSDVVIPAIYDSWEELDKNWRKGQWNLCKCDLPSEDVLIYSSYGFGWYWPGKACFKCKAIIGPLGWDEFIDLRIEGFPLEERMSAEEGKAK